MSPEGWGQVVSVSLQAVIAIAAGLVIPWAKKILESLNELKAMQSESNDKIERLNRRVRRHGLDIKALKERKCGGEHEV